MLLVDDLEVNGRTNGQMMMQRQSVLISPTPPALSSIDFMTVVNVTGHGDKSC